MICWLCNTERISYVQVQTKKGQHYFSPARQMSGDGKYHPICAVCYEGGVRDDIARSAKEMSEAVIENTFNELTKLLKRAGFRFIGWQPILTHTESGRSFGVLQNGGKGKEV